MRRLVAGADLPFTLRVQLPSLSTLAPRVQRSSVARRLPRIPSGLPSLSSFGGSSGRLRQLPRLPSGLPSLSSFGGSSFFQSGGQADSSSVRSDVTYSSNVESNVDYA